MNWYKLSEAGDVNEATAQAIEAIQKRIGTMIDAYAETKKGVLTTAGLQLKTKRLLSGLAAQDNYHLGEGFIHLRKLRDQERRILFTISDELENEQNGLTSWDMQFHGLIENMANSKLAGDKNRKHWEQRIYECARGNIQVSMLPESRSVDELISMVQKIIDAAGKSLVAVEELRRLGKIEAQRFRATGWDLGLDRIKSGLESSSKNAKYIVTVLTQWYQAQEEPDDELV